MSLRIEKVNSLIHKYVAEIISRELSLKSGVLVSVSKVDTSDDMRYTRIFVSVYPVAEKDYVEATLKKEIYNIQGSLNRRMQSKLLPRIMFIYEDRQQQVSELDEIFDAIRQEKGSQE